MKQILLAIGASVLITTTVFAEESTMESDSPETHVQDMEGNTYRTVTIGNQEWMAENLRATKYQDGSNIETAFIPKDKEENLLKYGRLYSWHDVSDERNLCPVGWRVASDDDWKELERTIGMHEDDVNKKGWRGEDDIAITLKEAQADSAFKKFDQSQVNKYGFSVRPAGVKWGKFYITQGIYSEHWTSTDASEKDAYNRTFAFPWWNAHKGEIYRTTLSKNYKFAVRCIKGD